MTTKLEKEEETPFKLKEKVHVKKKPDHITNINDDVDNI